MTRPRIVLLTPVMPAEGGNGLAMRAGVLLEGLSGAGDVEVLVIPVFGDGGSDLTGCLRGLAACVSVFPLAPDPDPVADLTARLATPGPRAVASALHPRPALCRAATQASAQAIGDRLLGEAVDAVVVFRLYLAPFLDVTLASTPRPTLLLDLDELDAEVFGALGQPAEADAFARLEAHYVPRFDLVTVTSLVDEQTLRRRYDLDRVAVIPNAVRPPAVVAPQTASAGLPPSPAERCQSAYDLLFVANLSYPVNAEAARWLVTEILPRLGNVRLAIVGSAPGPEVVALAADPRVSVAADVESVTPWYEAAKLVVVPVQAGGGTKTKVIEALAHARAVVATPTGVAGLPVDQSSIIVAEDPLTFAGACRLLLDNPHLAAGLAERGRQTVLATSTVAVVGAAVEAAVRRILPQ